MISMLETLNADDYEDDDGVDGVILGWFAKEGKVLMLRRGFLLLIHLCPEPV